jgi:hypothetical protein
MTEDMTEDIHRYEAHAIAELILTASSDASLTYNAAGSTTQRRDRQHGASHATMQHRTNLAASRRRVAHGRLT